MSELIKDVDPGNLPPRTRQIFFDVGTAIEQGWKPIELAQMLGVAPSFLSECIAELRTALGLVNGVFPNGSDEEYEALRESIGRQGVRVPIVMDDHGIIDGHQRARACRELAHIAGLADALPEWRQITEEADADRGAARELHGREAVDQALYLKECGDALIALAGEANWADPPIERLQGLTPTARRELAVTLNAHRRHLERGQLRLLVEVELMLDAKRPNHAIGSLVGCSEEWVRQIRHQLAEDEKLLANPQREVETQVVGFRTVAELECPHCQYHLALLRGGREFQLELTAGVAT